MMPTSAHLEHLIAERKRLWKETQKKSKVRNIMVYVCAYCGHRGLTLKKHKSFMVCFETKDCRERQSKLSIRDKEWLAHMRGE